MLTVCLFAKHRGISILLSMTSRDYLGTCTGVPVIERLQATPSEGPRPLMTEFADQEISHLSSS